MNFFKRLRRKTTPAEEPEIDNVPDMAVQEPETLAAAARQALRSRAPQLRSRDTSGSTAIPNADDPDENGGLPAVNRRRGAGNRVINALGIMVILALGAVMIYTINTPRKAVRPSADKRVERVENNLPPLVIAPPAPPPPVGSQGSGTAPSSMSSPQPIPLAKNSDATTKSSQGTEKPAPDWTDRKRAGSLMIGGSGGALRPSVDSDTPAATTTPSSGLTAGGADGGSRSDLAVRLEPTVLKAASASLLSNRNFLLAQGSTLDCALETALDSSVPGMTTCRLTRDVYSDNGQVLLLDRGTQLVGEYQGGMRQGQNRLFVLWSRAKTPNGVVITLNSPGTDALGRSGLDGWVDTHFAERFGAAILFSLFKDTLAYTVARQQSANGNTIVYGNTQQTGEQAVEKILESSINIPPTLVKNQGDHIQIMIARDLDFSSVYALREK